MPGLVDFMAQNNLNYLAGSLNVPALPSVWCGLFTTAPTNDAGTGGTEVSASGYARAQVAGPLVTNGSTAAGNATLHFATVPAWITVGMLIRDATTPGSISAGTTVQSITPTTVVMTANAAGAGVGNGDTITFSAFAAAVASVGTEPAVVPASLTSSAIVTFPKATADWGTVTSFALFDAATVGNMLAFDFLGAFGYAPATISQASPAVFTLPAHGFSAADNVVATAKYGGAVPTFSQSNLTGLLAVAAPVTTDTFTVTNATVAVNTSSTGDLMVRKVTTQFIPNGVTASFAAGQLVVNAA